MPRFMLFMLPGIQPEEYAEGPSLEDVEAMNRFNQDLVDAGVLLAADGLHPPERGRRVRVDDGRKVVTDGPFSEAKEVVGGYWIIQAKDLDEATAWAERVPLGPGPQVEVREIWEITDMSEEIQEAAGCPRIRRTRRRPTRAMRATSRGALDALWRIESPKLVAVLTRMVRDVGLAEDLAQDAMVAAMETWPRTGVPDVPGAWLMTTAKRRAIDALRRRDAGERATGALARETERSLSPPVSSGLEALDDDVGDDLLRLVLLCCHPVLPTESRIALTLRLVGGLTTEEVARAFLVPTPTVAQRISRAKRTLTEARAPFEVPERDELVARLDSVLEVVYLIFNEGYVATAGDDWMRPALCEDALRLVRVLARLAPGEHEVHGLAALLELQASRSRARTGPRGEPVLLLDQDRSRWDRLLIVRGLAALARAQRLGRGLGPYGLQAAIAACHASAPRAQDTDWARIAALYDGLAQLAPSPVVELNRAVAVGRAYGPQAGLEVLDALHDDPRMASSHLLPSVRADLLTTLGRTAEARTELERAAALTRNVREQGLLRERAAALGERVRPD
jgi:RNA polymerase sigma factor (sigma-70 family)